MKKLALLLICLTFFACNDSTDLQSKIQALEGQLAETKAQLAAAETAANQPGMIHSVFFWLKKDINETDKSAFLAGLKSLEGINTVKSVQIGPPAPTEERGVVDNTFSYALIVHFADVAGHDAYQVDPIHLKFVETQKDKWVKVVVYDNVMLD